MNIDSIENGLVLDHIPAGRCLDIYHYLHLDRLSCSVAIIKNAKSRRLGRKDIIKIDEDMDIDLDVLGYIDPGITVNVIKDGRLVAKHTLELPQTLTGVVRCRNPRCITSVENGAEAEFYLADRERKIYRCRYCDTAYSK